VIANIYGDFFCEAKIPLLRVFPMVGFFAPQKNPPYPIVKIFVNVGWVLCGAKIPPSDNNDEARPTTCNQKQSLVNFTSFFKAPRDAP